MAYYDPFNMRKRKASTSITELVQIVAREVFDSMIREEIYKKEQAKVRTITLKDNRKPGCEEEDYFEIIEVRNTLRYQVGCIIRTNEVNNLISNKDWEVIIIK